MAACRRMNSRRSDLLMHGWLQDRDGPVNYLLVIHGIEVHWMRAGVRESQDTSESYSLMHPHLWCSLSSLSCAHNTGW